MARAFSQDDIALLQSPDLACNVLATFYLDEGIYRFCDDQSGYDLNAAGDTYIGANALAEASEIRASQNLSAEQVTLTLDGNRMEQAGINDPARVLRDVLTYLYQQRRVDFAFGFRYNYSQDVNLIIPAYAGKINSLQLVDKEIQFEAGARTVSQLVIVLDSLAARYDRANNRTRSHEDQLEIDPTDQFYSFTADVVANQRTIYWGKSAPFSSGRYGAGPYLGGATGVHGGKRAVRA